MQQFLELFSPHPGNSYLLVADKIDTIAESLWNKLEAIDGNFTIALYGEGDFKNAKIERIDSFSKPFRAPPRENDCVILYDIFSKHASREMLLKLAYRTLANAAEIIIIEPKGMHNHQEFYALLESHEFRAPNCIEGILEGYDVFIAKKMHMWGNGL